MLVPFTVVNNKDYVKAESLTSNVIYWDFKLFKSTNKTLLNRHVQLGVQVKIFTICAIPLAPPPPKTRPIDLPHILLAKREKSFVCGRRGGRRSVVPPRYF